MRILVATHNYPRFPGDPAGGYVRQLALGFQQRGHTVQVLAPHAPHTLEAELEAGVSVRRFRYAPVSLERIGYRGEARPSRLLTAPAALLLPAYLFAFRRALAGMVQQLRPDVIHAHWWIPAGRIASRLTPPLVVTSHGSDVRLLERSRLLRRSARGVARRARRWTAASHFLASDIERLLDLPGGTVAVTAMPVDLALFAQGCAVPKAEPARILYAGNLLASKGVDILVRAVGQLRDRGVACSLRLLGEGPLRGSLEQLVRSLRLEDRVAITPFVPQSAMPAEYGAATVTVLPTRGQAEGLGLTLVEALVAGSAVVGTNAGGIPEVVRHGQTGLIVPDEDAAALADALEQLLADPALARRLTAAGQLHVRQLYSLDSCVDRLLAHFDVAVHDQPRH